MVNLRAKTFRESGVITPVASPISPAIQSKQRHGSVGATGGLSFGRTHHHRSDNEKDMYDREDYMHNRNSDVGNVKWNQTYEENKGGEGLGRNSSPESINDMKARDEIHQNSRESTSNVPLKETRSWCQRLCSNDISKIHHEDYDAGVNAMALLNALVLSVPYTIMKHMDAEQLLWMRLKLSLCEPGQNSATYKGIYTLFRGSFLASLYMAISGMILSTFYFLFKRTKQEDYKIWRPKARILVTSLFFATVLAFCSLILMTNIYFNYYLLSSNEPICNNDSLKYVAPGLAVAAFSFTWAFYLAV